MKTFIETKNRKLSKSVMYHVEDLSFSTFMKALRKRDVKVNGKRVSEDVMLSVGDKVEIYYQAKVVEKFSKVYQDDNVLIVNKKQGYSSESVFDDIKREYVDACFIHRLDRNTKGIMIFALNSIAEKELLLGFKNRTFDKKYHALVKGIPTKRQAIIESYLLKDKESAFVKIYDNHVGDSVKIKTGYKVLKTMPDASLLEVTLFTGKTHQIRAHLAYIGHPILGDGKYGDFALNEKLKLSAQQLSAVSLTLNFDKDSLLYYLNGKTFAVDSEF